MKSFYYNLIFLLTFCFNIVLCFEPISMTLGGLAAGAFYYLREPLKKYTYCKLVECCNEDYLTGDFGKLKRELNNRFYGQHVAQRVIFDALISHWRDKKPQKALTMSFHGWPGCGKNYATKFIVEALYKEGVKSKFVHHFHGRIHFPREDKVYEYKSNLQNWIKGNVSHCERSIFIFDEVDKMPATVLNAIKPLIDYNDLVEKVDYRKSIFIFLSNTGGTIIKDHLLSLWEKGIKRKDIELKDFERLIEMGAFNEEGGLHQSDTIKSSLIDHYIPFFPMEREQVELCVVDAFNEKGVSPSQKHINEVIDDVIEWGPPEKNIFSVTGCKRIANRVPLVILKHRLESRLDL